MIIAASTGSHRRGAIAAGLLFLAMLAPPLAFAAKPAVPTVSITASAKQLHFWWNQVPGTTRYELWFLPATGAEWVKYAQLPANRTNMSVNISAHLLHWKSARYVLKACNAEGCGRTPHLYVSHLMQQTVGYFPSPSSAVAPNLYDFGRDLDVAESGDTLAVAFVKDSFSAGVQVLRKAGPGWAHEAWLLTDPPPEVGLYGTLAPSVTISGNGDVIALGFNLEISPGADPDNEMATGAVYVFRRTSAGWVREQKLRFPVTLNEDEFGRHVELDESGTVLAAWRRFGDQPGQPPGPWAHQGFVELFRYSSGAWVRETTIPAVNDGCVTMGLSGDGKTIARNCGSTVEVFTAPSWQRVAALPNEIVRAHEYFPDPHSVAVSYDGTSFAVRSVTVDYETSIYSAWVNVYRLGPNGWAREASLAPGEWAYWDNDAEMPQGFGLNIAMNRDGRFLATTSAVTSTLGFGALYPPIATGYGNGGTGAVYVYERKPSGWRLRQFIKPNEGDTSLGWEWRSLIDGPLSFARNGKDLVVSGEGDPGAATVLGGPPPDPTTGRRGAVWLY